MPQALKKPSIAPRLAGIKRKTPASTNVSVSNNIMAKIATLTIAGKSGTQYEFEVYPLDSTWNEVAAVYTVTKRTVSKEGKGTHDYIYVGQTENLKERHDNHHKVDCFKRHAANCLCTHQVQSEQRRLAVEADILAGHTWPCNG
jgi:hypothetical protein